MTGTMQVYIQKISVSFTRVNHWKGRCLFPTIPEAHTDTLITSNHQRTISLNALVNTDSLIMTNYPWWMTKAWL